ncbi:hypothetical protein PLCT2_00264 [Planctomycetaceae bacterium]|nr:hypothetical protein PLCT2_00264 [Planctomycetaceae bacterium]
MPFKFDPPKHPKLDTMPRGTVEKVRGCAVFIDAGDAGVLDWGGETDVWWDEQKTVRSKSGKVQLIDHKGNTWWATMTEVK